MKIKIFLLTVLMSMVGVFTLTTLTSCGDDAVPTGGSSSTNGDNSQTSETSEGIEAGHKYVDLGLSVKWATCNVGADYAWDYGSYFDKVNNEKYKSKNYYEGTEEKGYYPPYKRIELSDDIAHHNWSGSWRTPTHEEWSELMNNCFWRWTTNYNNMGVAGYIVFKAKATADKGIVQCEGDYGSASIWVKKHITDI